MTRNQFERHYAYQLQASIEQLRKRGYHSAPCPGNELGWIAFAMPLDEPELCEIAVLGACRQGASRSDIYPFGLGPER